MAFPSEERLKNLIERVNDLEAQVYSAHPYIDTTFTGVVYDWGHSGSGGTGTNYRQVIPYPPTVNSAGDLSFPDGTFFTQSGHRYDKVYPINCPNTLQDLKIRFDKGAVISYWTYSGTDDDTDKIRGTFITQAKEYFVAKVYPKTSGAGGPLIFNYGFTAVYWSGTAWMTTDISGDCLNMNEVYNTAGNKCGTGLVINSDGSIQLSDGTSSDCNTCKIVPVGPTLARVFPKWNSADNTFKYYFEPIPNSATS